MQSRPKPGRAPRTAGRRIAANAALRCGPSPFPSSRDKAGAWPSRVGHALVVLGSTLRIDIQVDRRLVAGFLPKIIRWMPVKATFALRSSRPYAKRLKFLSWKGGRVV